MSESETVKNRSFAKRVVRKVIVLSVIFVAGLVVMSMTAMKPSHLGMHGDKLAPVPDSPNCVSSMTTREDFQIAPIDVSGVDDPIAKLKSTIDATIPRSKLVTEDGNYLHYEMTSLVFRFVDDSEFLFDPQEQVIHMRSASRVGHSDMGVNRKRMEKIRAAMAR